MVRGVYTSVSLTFVGCSCHQVNLLQKEELRSSISTIPEIVDFIEKLSNFIENSPKIRSLMKLVDNAIGLKRIPDYCPTRFLQLFEINESILEQYPVVKKIATLSKDQRLIQRVNNNKFVIHLDQFGIHLSPIHSLNKSLQDPGLDIYQTLMLILQCISKLLSRLGHTVALSPSSYKEKLYENHRKPLTFESKNEDMLVTTQNNAVMTAIHSESTSTVEKIRKTWDSYNEFQLRSMLKRFSKFLTSPATLNCFAIFTSNSEFDQKECMKHLIELGQHFNVNVVLLHDEVCELRLENDSFDSIAQLFRNGSMSSQGKYPILLSLVDRILLVCPHNMNVESGFSIMKSSESVYQNNMSLATYNAIRTIKTFYDRSNFEQTEPTQELLQSVKKASTKYTKEQRTAAAKNVEKEKTASSLRESVGIYKRHTFAQMREAEKRIEEELAEAEERLATIKSRKRQLEEERLGPSQLANRVSEEIVNQMFSTGTKVRIVVMSALKYYTLFMYWVS